MNSCRSTSEPPQINYLPSSGYRSLVRSISLAKTPAVILVCQTPRSFSDRLRVCFQVTVLPNTLSVCLCLSCISTSAFTLKIYKDRTHGHELCKNDANTRPKRSIWLWSTAMQIWRPWWLKGDARIFHFYFTVSNPGSSSSWHKWRRKNF